MKEQAIEVVPCDAVNDLREGNFHININNCPYVETEDGEIWCSSESEANTKADSLRAAQEPQETPGSAMNWSESVEDGNLSVVFCCPKAKPCAAHSKQSEPERRVTVQIVCSQCKDRNWVQSKPKLQTYQNKALARCEMSHFNPQAYNPRLCQNCSLLLEKQYQVWTSQKSFFDLSLPLPQGRC